MDGTSIQTKVDAGYAKAANAIGLAFNHYRPSGVNDPLNAARLLGTTKASFNPEDFKYKKPFTEKGIGCYGIFDGATVQVGDYLTAASGRYCFVEKKPLLPYYCIEVQRTVTITRPTYSGAVSYASVAANIPCAIVENRARVAADVTTDTPVALESTMTGWTISLSLPLGTLQRLDRFVDDIGTVYEIETPYHNGEFYEVSASVYTVDANLILRAIADAGQSVTLRTSSPGTYDISTGSAASSYADTTRRAVVTNFTSTQYGDSLIPTSRILAGDVRCLMDATGIAPLLSSLIVANTVQYAVIEVRAVNVSGATVSAYELLLRR